MHIETGFASKSIQVVVLLINSYSDIVEFIAF